MAKITYFNALLATIFVAIGTASAQCNPLINGSCPAIPGLATSTYSIDFTQQTALPSDWIQAEGAPVTFGASGANFTIAKRYDAPYIWTRFYMLFGRIETVVKVAPGMGIVTSAVMLSDDLDEIDWEWSGNNFGQSGGRVQTNWFGKGVPGNYDRGSQPAVNDPQDTFHTYVFDWTPDALTWSVDGTNVYTTKNSLQTSGSYQYPQTPSRLHLGMWAGGDQDNNPATVYWAGGYSNFSLAPFSAYVKSVKITTSNPCPSWQYPNPFNGTYQALVCTNQTLTLPCTYTVKAGDNGQTIATSLSVTLDALKAANPGLNWDLLVEGQTLNVPGAQCSNSTTSSAVMSTASTTTSSMGPNSTTTSSTVSTTYSSLSSATTPTSTPTATTTSSPVLALSTTSASSTPISNSSSAAPTNTSSASPTSGSPSSAATSSGASSPNSGSPMGASTPGSSNSVLSTSTIVFTGTTTTTSAQGAIASTYTVVAGDYGWAIASRLGCNYDALDAANPDVDWDDLQIGQILNAPCGSSSAAHATTGDPGAVQTSNIASASIPAGPSTSGSSSQSSPAPASGSSGVSATPATSAASASSPVSSSNSPVTLSNSPVTLSNSPVSANNPAPASGSSSPVSAVGSTTAQPLTTSVYYTNGTISSSSASQSATSSTAASSNSIYSDGNDADEADDADASSTSQSTDTVGGTIVTGTSSTTTPTISGTSNPTSTVAATSNLSSSQSIVLPTSTQKVVNPVTTATPTRLVCNQDNCLRNMIDPRYSTSMMSFCPTYTTVASNSAPLPTFLTGCSQVVSRVSSACSCLMTSYAPVHSSSSTPAMTGPAQRARTPSWRLKRSPLRWERFAA
ncbi:60S ribosomal protein L37 [Exophiala xenobiotica]|uniref:60S ribosomal protein L37 n=1 Tax=Vermiconidia calcicola TaxID=1690605 RepID=A0AAV9Q877_9PEZI|nr:60S ribosomal protein L37 [Exophiala xenobiotica]KAK5429191.1 60S ribosomal protein L37 [Exophiala xenobiotica]KAK5535080.1 60S ribosomal protein L37 [Vermiconidia calcicola]KAK5536260.1 60S ribosomal protein L37 [Chaetothyriales sp. CCFEE 6169]